MITVRQVQDACCKQFDISRDQLLEPCRLREIARPRQVTMYMAREMTGLGWIPLGRAFCRDHTTILHGYRVTMRIKHKWPWEFAIAAVRHDLGLEVESALLERIMRKRWTESVPRQFALGAYAGEAVEAR